MSTADMAVVAIKGGFDCFDVCRGKADHIKSMIDEDIAENGPTIEFHPGEDSIFGVVPPHAYSVDDARKAEVDNAIAMLNAAELICQTILAEI